MVDRDEREDGSPNGSPDGLPVVERDVTWAVTPDGRRLKARIYRLDSVTRDGGGSHTPRSKPRGEHVLVDVHGGAWNTGDRFSGRVYARRLAARGFTVASIDFRHAPEYRHPTALADVSAALRWAAQTTVGAAGSRASVGLIGSSSGGHLAMLAGVAPIKESDLQLKPSVAPDDESTTASFQAASPAYVVALWPVTDPLFRYRYALATNYARIVEAHRAYYRDESAMRDASVVHLLESGAVQHLPPLLVVQPGADRNVPRSMTMRLLRAYQSRQGMVEFAYFPDQPHGFAASEVQQAREAIELCGDFIRRRTRYVRP